MGLRLPLFTAEQLRRICARILEAAGASNEESEIVADSLVTSNLYGHHSHGVVRIPLYVRLMKKMLNMDNDVRHLNSPGIKPRAEFRVINETDTTAVLDGSWGFGHVIARRAMMLALEKSQAHCIGIVTIRNCNHIGRVGEYTELAARRGMIGIAMCNGGAEVAPYGSIDPIYGTCPISVAVPSNGRPILLDMTTSVVAGGKIALAIARNERVPPGWLIDSEGHPTTNPFDLGSSRPAFAEQIFKASGALLPIGGYKGSGLGLFVEIMCGILAGAGCSSESKGNGVVMQAININKFIPINEFKGKVDRLIRVVKNSRKNPGVEEILVPGEPEYYSMERQTRDGIYVEDSIWEAIKRTAMEFDLHVERPSSEMSM
jgi:uncharacterized oxidoreductase